MQRELIGIALHTETEEKIKVHGPLDENGKIKPGMYRHSKSNKLYKVLGIFLKGEENLVIYKPLYESEYDLFARPLKMFLENVQVGEKTLPRFKFIK